MGKRSPEWWEKVKKWAREQAKTAAFWLALLALLVLLVLLWVAFGSQDDCSCHYVCWLLGITDKTEAIKLLGFAIAGVMASWGVVAANRRSDAMADSAKADADTAKATEAGNRQRAFKDGVEHLGSDKSFVRQGGAHALFHLALEDDKLSASIAGFLCAHIRETTGAKDYQEQNKDKPSTEMQSLLKLLFTTETVDEKRLERFWQGTTPDLNGGYFRGVHLSNAQFRGAMLRVAQFEGAWLDKAQFQGAWLERVRFQGAYLKRAQFQGAQLDRAKFRGAYLERAQFRGAYLERAQFQGTRLSGSQFQGASLYMAGFQQAQFGQGPEHEGTPDQDHMDVMSGETVEQLKDSAFHGASSDRMVFKSFEERINLRTGKEFDFSEVIFSGGVAREVAAEVKETLKRWHWFILDSGFTKRSTEGLELEIGKDKSHTPPKKEVIAGSYDKEDAERWIREFREAMAKVPETNQADIAVAED